LKNLCGWEKRKETWEGRPVSQPVLITEKIERGKKVPPPTRKGEGGEGKGGAKKKKRGNRSFLL